MARSGRPASESSASEGYHPVCYSGSQLLSYSSEDGIVGLEDEDDRAPIFSLSKSSMDVVMATGPPHKRDPAWTRMDLKRSSSTNTHCEQNSVVLRQQPPLMWQHIHPTVIPQNMDMQSPPALSERWMANMQRWSECSGSTQSGCSTPETVIWRDGTSRPSSLIKETPCCELPDSPTSEPTSPSTTNSSFISALQTPDQTTSYQDFLTLQSEHSTHQPEEEQKTSPTNSQMLSPLSPHTYSPLPSSSSTLVQLTGTEEEGFLENNLLCFTFPSPLPSSVSLAEGGVSSDPECLVRNVEEELHSPEGTQLSEGGDDTSPVEMLSYLASTSQAGGQESRTGVSVFHLELPWEQGQSFPSGRSWRSPLVSSLSDSQLVGCCRCSLSTRESFNKVGKCEAFREEGTMTSQPKLVDAAVQTVTPIGSLWGLFRRTSTSNMGSHSILGSPPGSKLNLKSSVGSHSNLVSPSSSMFPVSSEDEGDKQRENPEWGVACSHDMERRRSCLKNQGEKDEMGRRGSMKQVQWDEDGMTWDIHGAAMDPEVLSTAIRRQLEIQNSPQPKRRPSKKKKAPKPPLIPNVVKAMAPELTPPEMIITSSFVVEGERKDTVKGDRGGEVEGQGIGKNVETVKVVRKLSRAEGSYVKEEEEVYGREGGSHPNSPSRGSGQIRKRSLIRSLRKPGWCGISRKTDD